MKADSVKPWKISYVGKSLKSEEALSLESMFSPILYKTVLQNISLRDLIGSMAHAGSNLMYVLKV